MAETRLTLAAAVEQRLVAPLDPNIGFTYKWLDALRSKGVEQDNLPDPICPGLLVRCISGRVTFRWQYKYPGADGRRKNGSARLGELIAKPSAGYRTLEQARVRVAELRESKGTDRETLISKTEGEVAKAQPLPVAPAGKTVQDAYDEWRALCVKKLGTADRVEGTFRIDILPHLGDLPVLTVTREQCRQVVRCMTDEKYHGEHALEPRRTLGLAPGGAAKTLQYMKQFFGWAELQTDYLKTADGVERRSPCAGLTPQGLGCRVEKRERALTPEEIPLFWHGLDARRMCNREDRDGEKTPGRGLDELTKTALRFLLLVPDRSGELYKAHPRELHDAKGVWKVPPEHQKKLRGQTMRAIDVPLAPLPLQLFRRMIALSEEAGQPDRVLALSGQALAKAMLRHFGSYRRGKQGGTTEALVKLPGDLDMGDVGRLPPTPHTLRHTFSSRCGIPASEGGPGVDDFTKERCMSHVKRGVEGRYDCNAYFPQRRDALARWADYVAKLVGETAAAERIAQLRVVESEDEAA